jgi:FkbM family methyltransferase
MTPFRAQGFTSQFGQDVVLDAFFRGLGVERGVFVDVGAHDGRSLSNTWYLEQEQGWSGVCIEPLPALFGALEASRSARCFNCAVGSVAGLERFIIVEGYSEMLSGLASSYDLRRRWRLTMELKGYGGSKRVVEVPVRRLDEILDECGIQHVDFLSVDVEGGELSVVQSIDFTRISIRVMAIENSHSDGRVSQHVARNSDLRHAMRIGEDDIYLDLALLSGLRSRP